jgi:ribonuclease BN (tRNA processing enzyme)
VATLTFLGTGNFLAPPGRYWNSFVLDANVLVEPSPTALPHLRRCGFAVEAVEVVVVSHFHADHCFGWPFLLQALAEVGGGKTVHVVGPPGIQAHLAQLNEAGAVGSVTAMASERLDLRFVEVDGSWQEAGPLRFRAVEVVHVPYLRCFGYLFERDGDDEGDDQVQVIGYSGDVTPCAGLTELAREADVLVLECNGRHTPPGVPTSHMDEESVRDLAAAHPDTHLILTHLGEQVDTASLVGAGVTIPDDFERLTV